MITIRDLINRSNAGLKAERAIRREDRMKAVYAEHPRLAEIDDLILEAKKNLLVSVVDGDKQLSETFTAREESLKKEREAYIKSKGVDPDFDSEPYICAKCRDTGFVKIKSGEQVCECRSEELEECYALSGMRDYSSFKMSGYKDGYFGEDKRRAKIKNTLLKIMVGVDGFKDDKIWIYSDKQQSGKTFLTIGVTKTAIRLGKSAYYIKLENLANKGQDVIEDLKKTDLLFIDDFAPDVTVTNGIGSIVNNLLEIRNGLGLKTIIVTSFTPAELISGSDMRVAGKLKNARSVIAR